jgi:hypothetical protein
MSDATWTPRTERERDAKEQVESILQEHNAEWLAAPVGKEALCIFNKTVATLCAALLPPVPAPPTRLREYKGVTYRDGGGLSLPYWMGEKRYRTAAAVIYHNPPHFTDADHAALMDLKANPTENAPDAVVEALVAFYHDKGGEIEEPIQSAAERTAATVRALVRAEGEAPPLTVAEHVAALEAAGVTAMYSSQLRDGKMEVWKVLRVPMDKEAP